MSDNVIFGASPATPPSGTVVSTEEVTTLNGQAVSAQQIQRVAAAIRTADGTAVDLPGDATNGLKVDLTRLPNEGQQNMAGSISVAVASDQSAIPISDNGGSLTVDGPLTDSQLRAAAVPVSASSLPLPAGGSTSANQSTIIGHLDGVEASLSSIDGKIPASPATAGNQTTGNASLSSIDGKLAIAKTADFDSGAGTDTVQMQGIALPKSGGAVAGGTSTDPLRTDPTGTTTQPVSASSLPLPTGAATSANQSTANTALSAIQTAVETLDNAIAGSEMQVDLVGPVPTGTNSIGQVTANAGANLNTSALSLESTQTAIRTAAELLDDSVHADDAARGKSLLIGAVLDDTTPASVTENQAGFLRMTSARALHTSLQTAIPAGANAIGKLAANDGVDIGDVTVNNASGAAAVNVQDGGNSLTVDAPVGTPVNVQVGDGTRTATVRDTGTSDSLNVAITDASGNQITSFGGGTEYTEDAVAPADPVGATFMMTRDDQLSTVTEIEGDWSRPRGTSKGALWVSIPDINGDPVTSFGGGTQYTEDVAAVADPIGTALNLIRKDSPAAITSTDGDNVAARGTNRGELYVKEANETASGSLSSSGQAVTTPVLNGAGTLAIQITGTWDTGTLQFEATVDDTNWFTANAYITTTQQSASSTQGAGEWFVPVAGFKKFRVRASTAIVNGPAVVNIEASAGTSLALSIIPSNSSVNVNQIGGTTVAVQGGSVNAGTQRVVLATDQPQLTNALKVDGSAVTQPVSGTVTANAGTNLNTSALALETTQSAIKTATELIDDTVHANDAALGKVAAIGAQFDDTSPGTTTENNVRSLRMSTRRELYTQIRDAAGNERGVNVDASGQIGVTVASLPNEGQQTMANSISVAVASDQSNLPVSQATASSLNAEVQGDVAEDAALAGNPVRVGWRASTAIPTAMSADGDAVTPWANRSGAPVVTQAPHVGLNSDPWNLQSKTAQYTTTQTSTVLQAGGASEKIVVTDIQIQVGGTTAGTVQVYFGTGAYVRGTNRAIFDGEFAPSATLKPGVVMKGPFISGTNGDDVLVTTSAAINPITVTIWFYVIT